MPSWTTDKSLIANAIAMLAAVGLTSILTYLVAGHAQQESRISVLENTSQRRDEAERQYREDMRQAMRRLEDRLDQALKDRP